LAHPIEVANAVFEHLEFFRDRQRPHSAIGWLMPMAFAASQARCQKVATRHSG
jgi:hypothetical protein